MVSALLRAALPVSFMSLEVIVVTFYSPKVPNTICERFSTSLRLYEMHLVYRC